MSSIGSNIILVLMKILNYKQKLLKKMKTGVDKGKTCPVPPKQLYQEFNITTNINDGCPVYTIASKTNISKVSILFFHGGAYVGNFNKRHWQFLAYLVKRTGATISAVDYPLAPAHVHKDTFDSLTKLYQKWREDNSNNICLLMGDSAGGGLAISLNLWAAENNIPTPKELILISPWVDITMENPDIMKISRYDPFISQEALFLCGEAYAGELNKKHYTLSPIFGDLSKLSKVHLITGTRDILYPDIMKFCDLAADNNIEINKNIYSNMLHDFVLFNFREAKDAKEKIADIIKAMD